MKKIISVIGIILTALGVGTGATLYFGSSHIEGNTFIMGSSSNFVSPPNAFYSGSATTTDTTAIDGGGNYIQQDINTSGLEDGLLCLSGVGGTATSTLFALITGSYDGTNFYNISTSTPFTAGATTTLATSLPFAWQIDFGTASTTGQCNLISVKGNKVTRFQFYTENASTDPNDGAQAYVHFIGLDEVTR